MDTDGAESWYSVRCILRTPSDVGFAYEERVTLWRVGAHEDAIALAESEAENYAADVSDETQRWEYVGLAQSYWLFDRPSHGAEVFSLIRESALDADEYLAHFFSTGSELQEDI